MGHSVFDELFEAADDVDVLVGVVVAFVARVEPTADERFCGLL